MFSRKRKFPHRSWKGRKRSRLGGSRYGGYGYGPVGGSSTGRGCRVGLSQAIIRQSHYIPDRIFSRLITATNGYAQTGASGAFALSHFRPSSAISTGGTFTTASPAGFPKWCSATGPYQAYIVHSFAYRVTIQMASSGGSGVLFAGVLPQPAISPAPASMLAIQGAPYNRVGYSQANAGRPLVFRGFHKIGQIYGQSQATVAIADSFSALYNATPASEIYFHVGVEDAAGATQFNFAIHVELTQYFEFFGRVGPT